MEFYPAATSTSRPWMKWEGHLQLLSATRGPCSQAGCDPDNGSHRWLMAAGSSTHSP